MTHRLRHNVLGALAITLLLSGATTPESPVADAAMRGDVERVRSLLREGADVDAAQGDGMTALHWAAERGDADLADVLLDAGADVAAVTRLGDYAPLHLATKRGHARVVERLLEAGADPETRTSSGGVAPLHLAAAAGSVEAVRALLDHGTEVDAPEGMWRQTPLMYAAAAGRTEVVRALLEAGADPALTARVLDMSEREEQDDADRERVEEMAERQRAGIVDDPPPPERPDRPEVPSDQPTREQIDLAQRDRVPTGRLSHAQLVGQYGGLTALLLAVRDGHRQTALALLDGGADIDQPSDGDRTPPLVMATINGHFDLAHELLQRGADPNLGSSANATALYTALNTQWIPKARHPQPADYMQQQVSYLDLMKALLDAGADVNARLERQLWYTTFGDDYLRIDRTGASPFWRAAYALDMDAMKLLLAYGADPDIPTIATAGSSSGRGRRGQPPAGQATNPSRAADPSGLPPVPPGGPGAYAIHAASGIGYGEGYAANIHRTVPDGWLPAVKFLVEELGADVNARDVNGYNAVHHAAARGDDELIEYLVSKGADVMAVSRSGQTTVDMANGPVQRISPFPSTIALLEGLGAVNNHNCVSC
jgi:ankyrin repeat protein